MANKPSLPVQIGYEHANDIRKELDTKIESKIDKQTFFWVIAILVGALLGMISAAFYLVFKYNDGFMQFNERMVKLETRWDDMKRR